MRPRTVWGIQAVPRARETNRIHGALGVVLSIVLVVAGAALFFGNGGSDLENCLNKAHGDQTAINQCNTQFQNKVSNGN